MNNLTVIESPTPAKRDLSGIYLKKLTALVRGGLATEDARLKAFYYLVKYTNETGTEKSREKFDLTSLDEFLLKGMSTEKFVQFFPIAKEYDGDKYCTKDYFYTVDFLREMGPTIKDPLDFLWEYQNHSTHIYLANKLSLMSYVARMETGEDPMKDAIENIFGVKFKQLLEIDGKEVLYDPETGKTTPVKKHRRKPKWVRVVKK